MRTSWKSRLLLVFALLVVVPLAACGSSNSTGPGGQRNAPSSILVLADSSLKKAFTTLGKQFEGAYPGNTVTFKYGASSALAHQAAGGAAGDVLATAGVQSMNAAQSVQLSSPTKFASKGQILYQIVTLKQSKNTSLSQQFINLVTSAHGQQVLSAAGFSP